MNKREEQLEQAVHKLFLINATMIRNASDANDIFQEVMELKDE